MKNSGFTLIELLVVVLIIGILSAVALPQYTKAVEKARMSEALSIISSLRSNVELYVLDNGFPPRNIDMIGSDSPVSLDNLNCESHLCASKYFVYKGYCGSNAGIGACYISASRKNAPDDTELYHISLARGEQGWDILRCFNWSKTDIGKPMCKIINGY